MSDPEASFPTPTAALIEEWAAVACNMRGSPGDNVVRIAARWGAMQERSRYEAREADARRAATEALDALDAYRVALAKAEDTEAELRGEVERLTGALHDAATRAKGTRAEVMRSVHPDYAEWAPIVDAFDALDAALAIVAPEPPSAAEEPPTATRDAALRAWAREVAEHSSDCHYGYEVALREWGEEEALRLFPLRCAGDDARGATPRFDGASQRRYDRATPEAEPPPEPPEATHAICTKHGKFPVGEPCACITGAEPPLEEPTPEQTDNAIRVALHMGPRTHKAYCNRNDNHQGQCWSADRNDDNERVRSEQVAQEAGDDHGAKEGGGFLGGDAGGRDARSTGRLADHWRERRAVPLQGRDLPQDLRARVAAGQGTSAAESPDVPEPTRPRVPNRPGWWWVSCGVDDDQPVLVKANDEDVLQVDYDIDGCLDDFDSVHESSWRGPCLAAADIEAALATIRGELEETRRRLERESRMLSDALAQTRIAQQAVLDARGHASELEAKLRTDDALLARAQADRSAMGDRLTTACLEMAEARRERDHAIEMEARAVLRAECAEEAHEEAERVRDVWQGRAERRREQRNALTEKLAEADRQRDEALADLARKADECDYHRREADGLRFDIVLAEKSHRSEVAALREALERAEYEVGCIANGASGHGDAKLCSYIDATRRDIRKALAAHPQPAPTQPAPEEAP